MRNDLPNVSVIVPTYARPERLAACLQAIARLDYPRDRLEVVVVDDGSPVSPEAITATVRDCVNLTLVRQPNAGPAAARNAGAARSRGEILAFTDDDCAPEPDWLRALAAVLAASPDALVGGQTVNALPENPYSTASDLLLRFLHEQFNSRAGQAEFFASNNIALPAAGFREVGGFSTDFPLAAGEDRDFCHRWRREGRPMQYAPAAVVRHAHHLTFRGFCRQHFHYGRGAARFHRMKDRPADGRLTPEPFRFYLDLLRYPLHQCRGVSRWQQATLFGLTQVATAAGLLYERLQGAGQKRAA